jgi:hypothetical protein
MPLGPPLGAKGLMTPWYSEIFFSSSLHAGRFTGETPLLGQRHLAGESKQKKGMKYEKTRKQVLS